MRWIVVSVSLLWLCPVTISQAGNRPCCPPDAITGCAAHLWTDYCQTQRRCHENLGHGGVRAHLLGAQCGPVGGMATCCSKPLACGAAGNCIECKIKANLTKCASCLPKLNPIRHYRWRVKSDCCGPAPAKGDCCDAGCTDRTNGVGEAKDYDVDPPTPPGEDTSFSDFSPPTPEA